MGRITVFSGEDYNSKVVLKALRDRQLPYVEISLAANPQRVSDLRALCGRTSVPRVFFNTRHVGGVDAFFKELRAWDRHARYATPKEAYDAELAPQMDPVNPKLQPSPKAASEESKDEAQAAAADGKHRLWMRLDIALPDGTQTTYHDVTEKLRNSLSIEPEVRVQGRIYKKVFSGENFVTTVLESGLTTNRSAATIWGASLLQVGLLQAIPPHNSNNKPKNATSSPPSPSLGDVEPWADSETTYYRLTADANPSVLNSYREWTTTTTSNDNNYDVWDYCRALEKLLAKIEIDSARADGILDCGLAQSHPDFPLLQQAVCRLQVADIDSVVGSNNNNNNNKTNSSDMLFFALSLYGFWLRYAFVQVGVPVSDADRQHFLSNLQFRIFGQTFTLSDWIDGVLRGNAKSPICGGSNNKVPFAAKDDRQRFVIDGANNSNNNNKSSSSSTSLDPRIHYALNVGSQVGSRSSLPFRWFSKDSQAINELALSASVFWEDESHNVRIQSKTSELALPQWIGWYQQDFLSTSTSNNKNKKKQNSASDSSSSALTSHLLDSFSVQQRMSIQKLGPNPKVSFFPTNWAKNASNFQRYDKERLVAEIKGLKAFRRRFLAKVPRPANDDQRVLHALSKLNILENLADERFDRVTRMMQHEFGTPFSMINFIDSEKQITRSLGTDLPGVPMQLPRDVALCSHTILVEPHVGASFVIRDLLQDDRFAESPAAVDFGIRFYAGVPLTVRDNNERYNVGTVCVMDLKPRDFTPQDEEKLQQFAAEVAAQWATPNNNNNDNNDDKTSADDQTTTTTVSSTQSPVTASLAAPSP